MKLRNIILAAAFVILGFTGFSFESEKAAQLAAGSSLVPGDVETGIDFFQGSWSEALKKADKEDKIIFLDAYAAWCGPCKMMAKQTFTDEKVGAFFNDKFINFKMDMEKHAEGPRLSKKFGLRAYPTLYFLDENENIVHQTLGFQDVKSLLAFGKEALSK